MKKIVSMILVLLICVSMLGCSDDKDVSGNISDGGNVEQQGGDDQEVDNQEADDQSEDVNLLIGEAEGDTYENAFLGIGFTLPEEWAFYTQEQINALNNITEGMLEEDIAEQIQNADIIYDMYALDQYGNSVNINLEKLSAISAISIDEKTYVESSMEQLPEALQQIGATDIEVSQIKVKLAGDEHEALSVYCMNGEVEIFQKIVCMKVGNYMANVTISTTFEDATDAVLTYFYEVEE